MTEHRPTCVVAEDERLLREDLVARLAEAWPQLKIVEACEDGAGAVEAIDAHRPDVAFLDIRMPGLTGLEVASAAAQSSPGTRVVFVTAYDQYAIDAFERGAVDYLLKPVTPDRLETTVKRLRERVGGLDSAALAAVIERLGPLRPDAGAPAPLTWITASAGRETRLVLVEDVAYFRADNKYTVVVTAEGEALLRTSIKELLGQLDPAMFKQIHRSTIVNLRAVASVVREDGGRGCVRLRGRSETLPVSAAYMGLFRHM